MPVTIAPSLLLAPCPLCGGTVERVDDGQIGTDDRIRVAAFIACTECEYAAEVALSDDEMKGGQ